LAYVKITLFEKDTTSKWEIITNGIPLSE